jgi:hypothetical protein
MKCKTDNKVLTVTKITEVFRRFNSFRNNSIEVIAKKILLKRYPAKVKLVNFHMLFF